MARIQDIDIPYLEFGEAAAPGTPAAAVSRLYVKADGLFYSKDDAGVETLVSGGSGGGAVATDVIWDAAGDLVVGSGANTAARLALGAAGGHVSRINGAVAWNSGTAFPTAATGDRYWRTDLGMEFYYDGTRWVSTEVFGMGFGVGDGLMPFTTTNVPGRLPYPHLNGGSDIWCIGVAFVSYQNATINGSNYWTLTVEKVDPANAVTNLASRATSADTVTTWTRGQVAVGALLGSAASFPMLQLRAAVTVGSPGTIYCSAQVLYRIVAT